MHTLLQALHSKVSLLHTSHLEVEIGEMNKPSKKILDLDFENPIPVAIIDWLGVKITEVMSANHMDWMIRERVKGHDVVFRGQIFCPSPVYSVGCGDALMTFRLLNQDVVDVVCFYNGNHIFSATATVGVVCENVEGFIRASVDGTFPKTSNKVFEFFLY